MTTPNTSKQKSNEDIAAHHIHDQTHPLHISECIYCWQKLLQSERDLVVEKELEIAKKETQIFVLCEALERLSATNSMMSHAKKRTIAREALAKYSEVFKD